MTIMAPAKRNTLRAKYARAKSAAQNERLVADKRARIHGKDSIKARVAKLNEYRKESEFLETRCQRLLTMIAKAKTLGNKKRTRDLEIEYMRAERAFNETGFKKELLSEELAEALKE